MDFVDLTTLVAHPDQALLPSLSDAEYEALRDSIQSDGLQVPIVVSGTQIVDGHHRVKALREIGETTAPATQTEWPADDLFLKLNTARRQLSQEARRDLVGAMLERHPERSDRYIAGLVGCDHKTVGAVRSQKVDGGEIPHHKERVGADGVKQAATKPPAVNVGGLVKEVFGEPKKEPKPKKTATPQPKASDPPKEDEYDVFAELERALEENAKLDEALEALKKDDTKAELHSWMTKYAALEGRLDQCMAISHDAQKSEKWLEGQLRKIRKELGVDRTQEIIPAIKALR